MELAIKKFKSLLKKSWTISLLSAWIKARLQERYIRKEHAFYCKESRIKNLSVLEETELVVALRKHLASRGLSPKAKRKGDINIFFIISHNFEIAFQKPLELFGNVSAFQWQSLGFNDLSCDSDWLKQRDAMNAIMLETFYNAYKKQPIDAVIGYISGFTVSPDVLSKMAESGVVVFNHCWDDKLYFRGKMIGGRWTGPAALASAVDLNLTNAPDSCIKYVGEGGLALFWPEAAHPEINKPYDVPFEFDVSFVGGKYGWRPKFIAKLKKMGIDVACFGNGWGSGQLLYEDLIRLYSRSRINLGFGGVGHSKRVTCLKGRDFEVPMSGGLYLTQDNPELSLVYEVGKEILTYKNEKDCAEKIKWLLANPEEAAKIREAGRERALKDHTWEKRFEKVFRLAGIME